LVQTQNPRIYDVVCFAQDQHTCLDFYSASSLKQQSVGRHDTPLRRIILMPYKHDHGGPWYDVGNVTLAIGLLVCLNEALTGNEHVAKSNSRL